MSTTSVHTASKIKVHNNTSFWVAHGLKVRAGLMAISSAISIYSMIFLFQAFAGSPETSETLETYTVTEESIQQENQQKAEVTLSGSISR